MPAAKQIEASQAIASRVQNVLELGVSMNLGYIKLHRKALESAVFQNANLWKVWCYCLMRANHKSRNFLWNGAERKLAPGQFITGRFEAAKDCNMKPSTLWYQFRLLKKVSNIDIVSDNKSSLITVTNWGKYQCVGGSPDSGVDNALTPNRQGTDTDKNGRLKEDIDFLTAREPRIVSEAQSVYDYYVEQVRAGNKTEAVRVITKLLPSHPEATLRDCIKNYSVTDMPNDRMFRIQPQNFFGLQERYKEYQLRGSIGKQPGNQNPPRFIDPDAEPWMQ
jgi:hypothetical protein